MLLKSTTAQAALILSAMRQVATVSGAQPLSDIDSHCLAGAARFIFRLDVAPTLVSITPEELARAVTEPAARTQVARFLAVMCLVDGKVDSERIKIAQAYEQALSAQDSGIETLVRSADGHLRDVLACMMRQNILSLSGKQWLTDDFMSFFLPYKGTAEDRALEQRFEDLQTLPAGSLGREYWQWYKSHGFAFPGNPQGLCWDFAVPHDSTHLLSGYDTSPHGELLVSTFTAGMHPDEPMEGHILPVIYSWHLNIRINDVATSSSGQFDPELFWEAWERGSETVYDVFDPAWDFWGVAHRQLDDLREEYGVKPAAKSVLTAGR